MKTEQTMSATIKQDEVMIPNNPVGSMTDQCSSGTNSDDLLIQR